MVLVLVKVVGILFFSDYTCYFNSRAFENYCRSNQIKTYFWL